MAFQIRERAEGLLAAHKRGTPPLSDIEVEWLEGLTQQAKDIELRIAPENPATKEELSRLRTKVLAVAKTPPAHGWIDYGLTNLFLRGREQKTVQLKSKNFPPGSVTTVLPRVTITATPTWQVAEQLQVDLRGLTDNPYGAPIIYKHDHPLYSAAAVILNKNTGADVSGFCGYRMNEGAIIRPDFDSKTVYDVLLPMTSPQTAALTQILEPLFAS